MIEALLSLGPLIIAAKLAEAALARFGVNSTIAYAATGILLGPVAELDTRPLGPEIRWPETGSDSLPAGEGLLGR